MRNTLSINVHSLNTAKKDELFAEALKNGEYLIQSESL